jgi:hypothetical protein
VERLPGVFLRPLRTRLEVNHASAADNIMPPSPALPVSNTPTPMTASMAGPA